MKKSAILLDVDHTLLFGKDEKGNNVLNMDLLNSLKKQGKLDLYLFTDMTFDKVSMEDRLQLIKQLENLGFKVHGVITPADLYWHKVSAEEAHAIINSDYRGRFYGEGFVNFLKTNENCPTVAGCLGNYPEAGIGSTFGQAFEEARKEMAATGNISTATKERSYIAKALSDHMSTTLSHLHVKGVMLDLFVRYAPKWVSDILVADDNADVLKTLRNFKHSDANLPMPTLGVIEVKDANMGRAFYDAEIAAHEKNPPIKISRMIDAQIVKLESGFNPFKKDPTNKVAALRELQADILTQMSKKPLDQIINDWRNREKEVWGVSTRGNVTQSYKAAMQAIISERSPSLISRSKPTGTEELIEKILKEFGSPQNETQTAIMDTQEEESSSSSLGYR